MIKTNEITKSGIVALLFALAFALPTTGEEKPESGKDTNAEADADTEEAAEEPATTAPEMRGIELLPVGKTNKGVRLPLYDKETGELQFVFNIGEMTPIDEKRENLDMVDLIVDVMGKAENGADKMKIELITANYNTPRGIISSDEETVVSRADFILVGETIDFDAKRGVGRMTGRTKMTIFNFKRLQAGGVQTPQDPAKIEEKKEKPPLPRLNIR
jgi:hypothetical protein